MTPPLHRHQLVLLTEAGWRRVLDRAWSHEVRPCLAHWAAQRLPLVVTSQHCAAGNKIATGLSAPVLWQRRRIALAIDRDDVDSFDEFPRLAELAAVMPGRIRSRWLDLCASLASLDATAHVFGSRGWQLLTRLRCVEPQSDVDLWIAVAGSRHADAVAAALAAFDLADMPRLDGELVFRDGRAVSWREWLAWRSGRHRAILTKSLHGAALVTAAADTVDQQVMVW